MKKSRFFWVPPRSITSVRMLYVSRSVTPWHAMFVTAVLST